MPLITDPDSLRQGQEITISTANKTIQLEVFANLGTDGVTGQALYSFLKEEWKNDNAGNLIPYVFPMVSITPEQFEFVGGWKPADETTRTLMRSCGWRELNAAGATQREYMGVISLGDIDVGDTPYYYLGGTAAKVDFDFSGPVNQGVQTFGIAQGTTTDNRGQELTVFIRSQGKTFGSSTTGSIGLSRLNYIANRFPLAEATDTKVTHVDDIVLNNAPYNGMSITFADSTRVIGTGTFPFKVTVEGNGGTVEQIYEFIQRQLRLGTDIDSGDGQVVGDIADSMAIFVGQTLETLGGVYITNFHADDTNRIIFTDSNDVKRQFPFVASGSLNFNSNLQADAGAIYRVFFTEGFGTAGALLVNNQAGTAISGTVGGNASVSFDFDYDNNEQGGRTKNTDAAVTVVAIGLGSAQYVSASATIGRTNGQNISLVAPLERNYSNPA